jgi:hypothetical protein
MDLGGKKLGGGTKGISPTQSVLNYRSGEHSAIRNILRRGWNTQAATGKINNNNRIITPFRAVNNSGDFLSRVDYVSGKGPRQSRSHGGLRNRFGFILANEDNSGVLPAATNVKYVYDHSDYIRYKKQEAMNHLYNDRSFGGYNNSAYVDMMSVGRFT